MPSVPRTGSPRLPVAIAAALLVTMTAVAAVAPEPIVGPPIAIGQTNVAVADPLVPVPPERDTAEIRVKMPHRSRVSL